MPDHYEVLGVPQDASPEDIMHAFRVLSLLWHPDTSEHPDEDEQKERLREINEAKEVLIDPIQRADYDRELAAKAGRPGADDDDAHLSGEGTHGVKLEPDVINFGDLELDGPVVEAYVVMSWAGHEPAFAIPPARDDWLTWGDEVNQSADDPRSFIITLKAQAQPGMSNGRYRSTFDININGSQYSVKLVARVIGAPSKPSTPYDPSAYVSPGVRSKVGLIGRSLFGLLAVIIAIFIVAAIATSRGNHPSAGGTPSPSSTLSFLLDLPSSQTLTNGTSFLLRNSDIFIMGSDTLTLWRSDGTTIWSEQARISGLSARALNDSPQFSAHCAIATNNAGVGLISEFISLDTGRQQPVAGYGILSGDRAAWSDGTIRDSCTGAILGRAAPNSAYDSPECLYGTIVIGTGYAEPLTAWQSGHELWQSSDGSAVCDSHGTTLVFNRMQQRISRINIATGQAYWSIADRTCATSCLAGSGPPYVLSEIGSTIIVSGYGTAAFNKDTGRLLWRKPSVCILATRTTTAEVLIGPCHTDDSGYTPKKATVVRAATGTKIRAYVGGYNAWRANNNDLLIVYSVTGEARMFRW